MKDSLKKGLIVGSAGSAICVLWHHLLTKKMMQLAMDRVAPQDRSNVKMRVSGSPEMIETAEIVKKAADRKINRFFAIFLSFGHQTDIKKGLRQGVNPVNKPFS